MQKSNFNKAKKPHKDLFVLPNGKPLKYSPSKEQQPYSYTRDNDFIRTCWAKEEEENFCLHGWGNKGNQFAVFADFQSLPEEFKSFEKLHEFLMFEYLGRGISFRTDGGTCRSLFVVETPLGVTMNETIALDTLKTILNEALFNCIDKSKSCLSSTFLNPHTVEIISNLLNKICVIQAVIIDTYSDLSGADFDNEPREIASLEIMEGTDAHTRRYCYRQIEGEIDLRLPTNKTHTLEGIFRCLLAMSALTRKCQISQKVLGETIGVSQPTAGRYLRTLVKDGYLKVVDATVVHGEKAYTYKASGMLLTVLLELYGAKKKNLEELPTTIEDGNWNNTLKWVAVMHFQGRASLFLKWAFSLPGIEMKDRKKQAIKLAEWIVELTVPSN